jgi:ribose transport system permease protein
MTRARRLLSLTSVGLAVVDLVAVAILLGTSPAFHSTFNLYIVLRDISVTLLVALAQMVVLTLGQMNLSIGGIGGLVTVVVGYLMTQAGLPVVPAALIGLALGVGCGIANGMLVRWTKISSFILTLATWYVFLGINLGITKGVPYYHLPHEYERFGQARVGFFPYMALITIPITIALGLFLKRMVLGRQMLAVGGNPRAAELSGLPVGRVTVAAHLISGALAATAAILLTAQLGSAQPSVGDTWVLPSFAGPIIGGAALAGGSAPIGGTILAVVLIALIDDGLVLLNANPYWVQFLIGALILAAVVLGRIRVTGVKGLLPSLRRLAAATPAVGPER